MLLTPFTLGEEWLTGQLVKSQLQTLTGSFSNTWAMKGLLKHIGLFSLMALTRKQSSRISSIRFSTTRNAIPQIAMEHQGHVKYE